MQMLKVHTLPAQNLDPLYPVLHEHRLSLTARYCIRKLLRQVSDHDSAQLLVFKAKLSANNCDRLMDTLYELYPDEVALAQVVLRLENLVYFYTTLGSQLSLYPEQKIQLVQIEQEIFHLLGFRET